MITNPTNEHREQAREPIHAAECAWQRTTGAECEYRETHHYCPHPEHACTCPPRTKPFVQHLDERMISADDVLGFLLAAEEGDEEDMTDRGVRASVRMLLEIAKRRKETGALYTNRATEQPPERLYVRLTAIGGTISHVHDPRQAYGKNVPVYEYVPASALSSRDVEVREVLEGRLAFIESKDLHNGWSSNQSGPCCKACQLRDEHFTGRADALKALTGCRNPFQLPEVCQCHLPVRQAVKNGQIEILRQVLTLAKLQPGKEGEDVDK